jgi:hypothetical protein
LEHRSLIPISSLNFKPVDAQMPTSSKLGPPGTDSSMLRQLCNAVVKLANVMLRSLSVLEALSCQTVCFTTKTMAPISSALFAVLLRHRPMRVETFYSRLKLVNSRVHICRLRLSLSCLIDPFGLSITKRKGRAPELLEFLNFCYFKLGYTKNNKSCL